jgi:protein-S-isoprenylcysteine O-methyltransferase Ste14
MRYWQAWIFWFEFAALVVAVTIYLLVKDPALVERRLKGGPTAEKQKSQRIIQLLAMVFFSALFVLPAVDHRLGWSHLSWWLVLLGNVLVVTGWFVIFLVFRENSFASSIIEVDKEQRVVSTGPYRQVRHPLYAGALIFMLNSASARLLVGVVVLDTARRSHHLAPPR